VFAWDWMESEKGFYRGGWPEAWSAIDRPRRHGFVSSDDLTSRNLRRAQFQHQAQICPREERLRRVEILAQFLDHLVGGGVRGVMQTNG
jgi:hypothetical protein